MSDHDIHDPLDAEDLAIDQALREALANGVEPVPTVTGEVDPAAVRDYTELLGLLAYQVGAETPDPHIKSQLLARLAAGSAPDPGQRGLDDLTLLGSSAETDSADVTLHRHGGGLAAPEAYDPVDKTLHQPATGPEASGTRPTATPFPTPTPMPSRSSWGSYAMAAVLALSLVGLGYLGALVGQQRHQIELLQAQVVDARPPYDLVQTQRELDTLKDRLNMVTTIARRAYPMRQVNTVAGGSQPEGIVYVCGQHQRWYLSLRGLEPPDADHEYHLWFMTEQGKIDGGRLDVRDDTSSEMEAVTMPDGTHGFLVTLEPIGSAAANEDESLTILLGERAIHL